MKKENEIPCCKVCVVNALKNCLFLVYTKLLGFISTSLLAFFKY